MQLIAEFTTTDRAAWKKEFEAEAENIRNAGLTVLQVWHAADEPATTVVLFEVNDRARAQAWLDKEAGFGAAVTTRFVRTA